MLNVYWYKVDKANGNFGDELNHFIISKLSGERVKHIIIPSSGWHYLYILYLLFKNRKVSFKELPKLIKQFFINDFIVGIGSVISIPRSKKAKIWGSGIIKKNSKINEAKFYAVRGKYTQKRLTELGFKAPSVLGDPALLLPLIYEPVTSKRFKIGIIPHYVHYKEVRHKVRDENIKVINLTGKIEEIINEINSCDYTISTSLHGIIVSHAYRIPSLWVDFGGENLSGDDIKFADYFSSVGIKEYLPCQLDLDNIVVEEIIEYIKNNKDVVNINIDLKKLQNELIKVAPFSVKNIFKK